MHQRQKIKNDHLVEESEMERELKKWLEGKGE